MNNNHRPTKRRLDYDLIERLVPSGARVLDLGCGNGELLSQLASQKGCRGYGIEINEQYVVDCIRRGVNVYHGDMMEGMANYHDHSFDLVILSQTLQQANRPLRVIQEMLRVGQTAVISFPNFGYWRVRLHLLFKGRMPMSDLLPYAWHTTPNVHLCTVTDFRELCATNDLARVQELFLVPPDRQISPFWANWRAGLAIFQIKKQD